MHSRPPRKYGVKGPYFRGQGNARERYMAHLEPGLRERLQEKADARGTSLNNIINTYLREKIDEQNPV
jgi:predicted HicB family RNase H-like nuclease